MIATYRMIKKREYTKTTGEKAVAHNVELTVPEVGTGDFYVSEETYEKVKKMNLKDGDKVELVVGVTMFRGAAKIVLDGVKAA